MYNELAIKWIKSVTRDSGNDWAYMEYNVGDIFELRFPNNFRWFPTNYSRTKPNDLMVLFQTLNEAPRCPGGSYITHLVTPVDEIVEQDDHAAHPYRRQVCVVGKADPGYRVNLDEWNFKKPNRGQIVDIIKVERRRPPDFTLHRKQLYIWGMFNNIDVNIDDTINRMIQVVVDDDEGVDEGADRVFLKLHKNKERSSAIVAQAKYRARSEGRFFCEVCTFNFETEFPALGTGFIECHHKLPIATGGIRRTLVEDLAIVCSNCHRMLHRKYQGIYLTVEDLRTMVLARRATNV